MRKLRRLHAGEKRGPVEHASDVGFGGSQQPNPVCLERIRHFQRCTPTTLHNRLIDVLLLAKSHELLDAQRLGGFQLCSDGLSTFLSDSFGNPTPAQHQDTAPRFCFVHPAPRRLEIHISHPF
jgi:hypothetical protein